MMSSIARGLQPSFYWPGSGGGSLASAGESQPGNLRAAVAGNTISVGGHGDGFLGLNENHESLHHIGSTWTGMLGHASMVDHGGGIGNAPFAYRWLVQSGLTTSNTTGSGRSFGTISVVFPIAYGYIPFVSILNAVDVTSTACFYQLSNVTPGGFTSNYTGTSVFALPSVITLVWESDGTVPR